VTLAGELLEMYLSVSGFVVFLCYLFFFFLIPVEDSELFFVLGFFRFLLC
jgi:hypothetical protein